MAMPMTLWIKRFFYIIIAILMIAISVNMFLAPHDIAAGGITGLAIILERLFSFERSIVILIANAVLLVFTFLFLGRQVFFNTVIGAGLLPLFVGFVPHITLIQDTMLSMVVGSVMFGIAVSVLYRNHASSGGTSIPPLILKKYFNMNPSIGLFITDGFVVALCLTVFSIDAFFFAIFSIFITSATMRYIETGISRKKLVYIISDMHKDISNAILNQVQKGVTIVPIIGGYQKKEMHMLMVTLDSRKYHQLMAIINRYDETAFVITDTVSDVHGRGFTYESGSV